MKKKQASLILPLYILCAFLSIGLAVSYVFQDAEEDEAPPAPVIRIVKTEPDITVLSPGVEETVIEEYAQNPDEDEKKTEDFPDADAAEIFENVLSVFTELEEPEKVEPLKPIIVKRVAPEDPAYVVIIIDDMGINRKWSREMSKLSGPLTLSFLPYAEDLQAQADYAKAHHHHLMMHMPMEALGGKMAATPGLLRVNETQDDFLDGLYHNLNTFEGFYGINNHMGSRLTQDKTKMILVMDALKEQGLYFVDSRTIHDSVAADMAGMTGLPYLVRDVFLDHEDNPEYVRQSLQKVESLALKNGTAIAIGHPKQATYDALKAWLPTLKEKNIQLIDAGTLIRKSYPAVQLHAYHKAEERPLNSAAVHTVGREGVD